MTRSKEGPHRFRAIRDWVLANPGDAVTLGLVAALISLSLVAGFVPGAVPIVLALLAAVLSASTILTLIERRTLRGFSRDLKTVSGTVSRIEVVTSSIEARTSVREVSADSINSELKKLLVSASEWRFRGGSARWQRTDVFPALAEKKRAVQYKALILSPFDSDLCERYARYRRQSREDNEVTGEWVRRDLLSFIYAAAVWAESSQITPEIALITTYSPLRVDGSTEAMMVTVADQTRPALRANADGWYYLSLQDEFRLHGEASPLTLPTAAAPALAMEVSAAAAFFRALLAQNAGLDAESLADFKESDWQDIVTRASLPDLSG